MQANRETWTKKMEAVPEAVKEEWKLEKQEKRAEKKLKVAKSELKTMLELYGMPKRPLYAFFMYSSERRPKIGNSGSVAVQAAQIGQEWNAMTKQQKKPYESKAKEGVAAYEKAMTKWNNKMVKEGKMASIDAAKAKVAALKA